VIDMAQKKRDLLKKMKDNKKVVPKPLRDTIERMQPMAWDSPADRRVLKLIEAELDRLVAGASDKATVKNTTKVGW